MSEPTEPTAPIGPTEPTGPVGRSWPGLRVRTLVFGLILLAVSGSVLTAQLTSIRVDPGIVGLSLMLVAGVLLIAGSATRKPH
jgi:hypothetical protein